MKSHVLICQTLISCKKINRLNEEKLTLLGYPGAGNTVPGAVVNDVKDLKSSL